MAPAPLTLLDVLQAFVGLSLLLLAAVALRRRLGWLERLGLPEALVAGLLGLAIGPFGPLKLVPDPVLAVWRQAPGVLITVVFATLFLGQRLPPRRQLWQRAASQTAFGLVLGFGQYLVGGLAVLLLLGPLLGSNPLLACLIEVGFEGGHGTAAGMGRTFAELGLADGEALGLAMATAGILAAVLVGSALVVLGRAAGWLREEPPRNQPAASPPAQHPQAAAAQAAAPPTTIDALTVNLALIGAACGLGLLLRQLLRDAGSALGGPEGLRLLSAVPLFPLAMIGGLLVQLLLQRTGQSRLAAADLQGSVGSLAMDGLITAAMASLDLPVVRDAWLPLLVLALLGLSWNLAMVLLLAPRVFRDAWFERAIADFGQGTGVTATGLVLLRMADPHRRSSDVLEAFSCKQLLFEPFLGGGLVTAFAPIALQAWGLPLWTAVSFALTLAALLLGLRLGRAPRPEGAALSAPSPPRFRRRR